MKNAIPLKTKKRKGCLGCTGCSRGADAEYIHPDLKVPICGLCFKSYTDKSCSKPLMNVDKDTLHENELACSWCKYYLGHIRESSRYAFLIISFLRWWRR